MTNIEILEKVYYKAKLNGFDCKWSDIEVALTKPMITIYTTAQVFRGEWYNKYRDKEYTDWFSLHSLLYDHAFAKAFFGSKRILHWQVITGENSWHGEFILAWQYHLQQMVLEKEPLKYLEKFL